MAQFFRIIEHEDGSWSYRRGRADLKRFWQLDDAIEHVTGVASEGPPSKVLINHLDGRVDVIATFD